MDTNIPTAWMDDERQVVRPRGDPRCGALKVNTDLLPLSNESTDINSVFSGTFFSLSKIPREVIGAGSHSVSILKLP